VGVTPSRWFGAAVIVGLLALLLSLSLDVRREAAPVSSDPLAVAVRRLTSAAGDVQLAVHEYRSAQALDRWKRARAADPGVRPARLDQTVPRAIADSALSAVRSQWSRLGAQSPLNAEVFVFVDTSTIPRADAAAASRRSIEPRRLVDVSYALPEVTDGDRCVVLVRLRGTSPAHLAAVHAQRLIGVCGFYAVFGMPGDSVRSWLRATGHAFARQSDWHVARAPVIDATSAYALHPDAARCLTGETRACHVTLGVGAERESGPVRLDSSFAESVLRAVTASPDGWQQQRAGEHQGRYLADVVRDLGPERFARFWHADGSVEAAFAAAAGVDLAAWTETWLARTYGAVPDRPSVRTRDVVWLAVAAPLLLLAAARPREQLLIESLRRRAR
jgi:hypothetical protein